MTQHRPPLTTLRAFIVAARHQSFLEAAGELGVTPSAISHQVRILEEWVGASLFARSARQVRLTPLGSSLFKRLDKGFATIEAALDDANTTAKDLVLRVSALPLFTSIWLIPRLARFEARAGTLAIEIDTSSALADMDASGIDVAIRNVPRPQSHLVSRKLLDLRAVPMCTSAVAQIVRRPEDLAQTTLIHLSAGTRGWKRWLAAVGCDHVKPKSNLTFDTIPAALEAAANGRGVMLGLDPIIWDASASRGLVIPFRTNVQSADAYFIVYRRADQARYAVRVFSDWLVEEMRADSRRLKLASRRAMAAVP